MTTEQLEQYNQLCATYFNSIKQLMLVEFGRTMVILTWKEFNTTF